MSTNRDVINPVFSNTASFLGSTNGTLSGQTVTVSTVMQQSPEITGLSGTIGGSGVVVSSGSVTISSGDSVVYGTISTSPYSYNSKEPVVGQSSVSVYQVAALLGANNSIDAVQQEFPPLSRAQIKAAWNYAKRHPNPVAIASYPTKTLKDFAFNTGFDKLK